MSTSIQPTLAEVLQVSEKKVFDNTRLPELGKITAITKNKSTQETLFTVQRLVMSKNGSDVVFGSVVKNIKASYAGIFYPIKVNDIVVLQYLKNNPSNIYTNNAPSLPSQLDHFNYNLAVITSVVSTTQSPQKLDGAVYDNSSRGFSSESASIYIKNNQIVVKNSKNLKTILKATLKTAIKNTIDGLIITAPPLGGVCTIDSSSINTAFTTFENDIDTLFSE